MMHMDMLLEMEKGSNGDGVAKKCPERPR